VMLFGGTVTGLIGALLRGITHIDPPGDGGMK
jgi:hypothetical protein